MKRVHGRRLRGDTRRGFTRRGFTLLELTVALTLTAIAAAIAGTAIGAARRTGEVVAAHQRTDIAASQFRALLADMLRHAPDASLVDDALLQVDGEAAHPTLRFVSRGVRAPLGTGPTWRVALWLEADTLRLEARPLTPRADAVPLIATLSGVRTLAVRVLERANATEPARWRGDWPLARSRPAAVAVQWEADGASENAPLLVPLDPLGSGTP